jgi:hypothetical protein
MVDPAIRDYVAQQGVNLDRFCEFDGSVAPGGFNWNHDKHQHLQSARADGINWSYFTCSGVCPRLIASLSQRCFVRHLAAGCRY